jgi:hypothetical protein
MDTINVHEQRLATDAMVTDQPRPASDASDEIVVADCDSDSNDLVEADEEEEDAEERISAVFRDEEEDPDDIGAGEQDYVPEGEPRTPGQKKRKSKGPSSSSRKRKLGPQNDNFDVVWHHAGNPALDADGHHHSQLQEHRNRT